MGGLGWNLKEHKPQLQKMFCRKLKGRIKQGVGGLLWLYVCWSLWLCMNDVLINNDIKYKVKIFELDKLLSCE